MVSLIDQIRGASSVRTGVLWFLLFLAHCAGDAGASDHLSKDASRSTELRGLLEQMGDAGGADHHTFNRCARNAMSIAKTNSAAIFDLLDDEEPDVVLNSLYIIMHAKFPETPVRVEELARESPHDAVRRLALMAVADDPGPSIPAFVLSHLRYHPEDLARVMEAMARSPRIEYVPFAAAQAWCHPDQPGHVDAIRTLHGLDTDASRCALIALLAHPDHELGMIVAYRLHRFPPKGLDALHPFLHHPVPGVRAAAVSVLPAIGSIEAKQTMQQFLQDGSEVVREAAADAIRYLENSRNRGDAGGMKPTAWDVETGAWPYISPGQRGHLDNGQTGVNEAN